VSTNASRVSGGPPVIEVEQTTESRTAADAATRVIVIRWTQFPDPVPKVTLADDDELVQTVADGEIGAFREILTKQAVRVFVAVRGTRARDCVPPRATASEHAP